MLLAAHTHLIRFRSDQRRWQTLICSFGTVLAATTASAARAGRLLEARSVVGRQTKDMKRLATNVAIDKGFDVDPDRTAEITRAGERNDFRRRDAPTAFPQIAAVKRGRQSTVNCHDHFLSFT